MKSAKRSIWIGLAAMVIFFGCQWFDKLTKFTIPYSRDFIIPKNVPVNTPYNIHLPYFATNSKKYFEDNKTDPDLLEGCRLTLMRGNILNQSEQDFSFLSSIHIFLKSKTLPEVEIAYKNTIPPGVGDTILLDIPDVELVNYIKEDSLGLHVLVSTNTTTTTDIEVHFLMKFVLDAKILGI